MVMKECEILINFSSIMMDNVLRNATIVTLFEVADEERMGRELTPDYVYSKIIEFASLNVLYVPDQTVIRYITEAIMNNLSAFHRWLFAVNIPSDMKPFSFKGRYIYFC